MAEEQLYYVQDTRQMVGNCVLWWCPEGKGYTTQLDQAGLYTKDQILSMRSTDIGWPKKYVERYVVRHVRHDNLLQEVETIERVRGR